MHGVAAKVAIEVLVLFEDGDVHTGAGQQITEHHTGGSSSDNTAGRSQFLIWHFCLVYRMLLGGRNPQILRLRARPTRKGAGRKDYASAALRMTASCL